jgi:hypothetical protein
MLSNVWMGVTALPFKTRDETVIILHPKDQCLVKRSHPEHQIHNTYNIYELLNMWRNTQKSLNQPSNCIILIISSTHNMTTVCLQKPIRFLIKISPAWNIMVFIYLFCLFLVPLQGTIWTGLLRCTWPNHGSKSTWPLWKSGYRPLCLFHHLFGNFGFAQIPHNSLIDHNSIVAYTWHAL